MGGNGSGNFSRVSHLDFEELVKKSLIIQMRYLDDPDISDEKKVDYASRYLLKRVGEKIELAVEHTLSQEQVNAIIDRLSSRYQQKHLP